MRLAFFSCIFSFLFDLATVELSQTGTADEAEDSLPLGFAQTGGYDLGVNGCEGFANVSVNSHETDG